MTWGMAPKRPTRTEDEGLEPLFELDVDPCHELATAYCRESPGREPRSTLESRGETKTRWYWRWSYESATVHRSHPEPPHRSSPTCVFRSKPNTDSTASRTLIPEQAEHRFRRQAEHFSEPGAESVTLRQSGAWRRPPDSPRTRRGGRGGPQETVHAKDQGDPAPQVRGRTLTARHRPRDRRLELDGLGGLLTTGRGRALVAAAGGHQRRRAREAPLPRARRGRCRPA